jgi:hypothetical protein
MMRRYYPFMAIVIIVTITHFPLLLMDGTYWDDWVLKQFILERNFGGHFDLWNELGLPGYAVLYWVIGSLGPNPVIAHNVLTFILLIISALLVYAIGRKMQLSEFEAMIIAITASVYTALETTFVFNVTVYLLMLTLFLGGVYVALQKGAAMRVVALVLFTLSFQHNSLLVFYGGFLLLKLLQEKHVVRFVKRNIDFLLLPIIFWFAKETLTDSVAYYNRFNPAWSNVQAGTLGFLSKGVMEQGRDILRFVSAHLIAWGGVMAIGVTLVWKKYTGVPHSKRATIILILFGLAVFICAIAPYVLVSKGPRAHGYTTRHALLIAIPIGILIVGSLRILLQKEWGKWITSILLSTALTGSVIAHWTVYIRWQERWIKDYSLITYFEDHPELKKIGTYILDDQFPVTSETYRYYEWSAMVRQAWGVPGYLVMEEHESFEVIAEIGEFHPRWKEWYHLDGYPRAPCEAMLKIEPGETNALNYTKIRLFGSKEEMRSLLHEATVITVTPKAGCRV